MSVAYSHCVNMGAKTHLTQRSQYKSVAFQLNSLLAVSGGRKINCTSCSTIKAKFLRKNVREFENICKVL